MPLSIGLELGASTVRAALLDPRSQPPRLLAAVSVPWGGTSGPARPASSQGAGGDELLRAIQQARKTLPITSPVVLGLPTTVAIVTTVQPLIVNRIRMDLAVRFELQQHLPYDVAQTAWHYQWLSLNGSREGRAGGAGASSPAGGIGGAAVVAAVKQSVLQERLTMCRRAGVAVKGVQINALAVANAWLRSAGLRQAPPGLVVRLDGRVLEWLIIASHGLYVFPNLLPLPATLSIPLPAASRETSPTAVGAQAGTGQAGESLIRAGLAQADHDQLTALFKTSWEGLQTHLESAAVTVPPVPSVWLVGGSSSYPQLGEALQRAIGCTVQPLSTDTIARAEAAARLPADDFVATCGLALQGAGATRISLNLVDQMVRARRVARLRRGSGLIGLVSVLLAALWSVQGILTSLRSREAVLEHSRQQEHSYQLLRPEVRAIRRHQAHLEHRLKQLEYLARTHDRMTRSFVQITEALPDSLWLTTLDLTKNIPQMTGTLEGYAQSFQGVTQYIDRLKAAPEWITVKPQATNVTIDPTTSVEVVAFAIYVQRVLEAAQPAQGAAEDATPSKGPAKSTPKKSPTRAKKK